MERDGKTPPVINRPRHVRLEVGLGLLVVALAGGIILYHFDPVHTWFYPHCTFHALTGLNCPGCGGLRALHKLLHGDVIGALRSNALVVLLVPIALWLGLRIVWQAKAGTHQAGSPVPIPLLWLLLGAAIAFGVLRNLPGGHFGWLTP